MSTEPVPNQWCLVWNIPMRPSPSWMAGGDIFPRVAIFATEADAREWAATKLTTAVFITLYELRERLR